MGGGDEAAGGGAQSGLREDLFVAREKDPFGRGLQGVAVAGIGDEAGVEAEGAADAFDDGSEAEVEIGDVHGEDAARFEVGEIELQGLAGEQVDGDGVA